MLTFSLSCYVANVLKKWALRLKAVLLRQVTFSITASVITFTGNFCTL